MTASARPVTVVVVTWNALEHTRRCLDSLMSFTEHEAFTTIVCDNASTDGTPEYVSGLAGVRLLTSDTNTGFSAGVNRALREVPAGQDVVLLNNDVVVRQPDWLSLLQEPARDPAVGIVGCRLVSPEGRLEHAGAFVSPDDLRGHHIGDLQPDVGQYAHRDRRVEAVTFACVLLTGRVIAAIGLLDESYHAYYEDTDYCLRAGAAGFAVVCCGAVTAEHARHASSRANGVDREALADASQRVFARRWAARLRARPELAATWVSSLAAEDELGRSSRELARALIDAGVALAAREPGGSSPPRLGDARLDDLGRRRSVPGASTVVYGPSGGWPQDGSALAYTGLDGRPRHVAAATGLRELWVTSESIAEAYGRAGLRAPVHAVSPGFAADVFHPSILARRVSSAFTFVAMGEWGAASGFDLLVRAFARAFGASDEVLLVCHIRSGGRREAVTAALRRSYRSHGSSSRIVVALDEPVQDHELGMLYRSGDCFVSARRRASAGSRVLEAMGCGLPVVAPLAGPDGEAVGAAGGFGFPCSGGVPCVESCADRMREVFEDRAAAADRGLEASTWAHGHRTWDHTARRMRSRLEALAA